MEKKQLSANSSMKILGKKLSMRKLAKKVKAITIANREPSRKEYTLMGLDEEGSSSTTTPTGTFAVYVGEDRERFVLPTGYLSHPLFKMLLDKAYNEFGFNQRDCLVVPCSINAFHEVISAVECCNRKFDFGELVEEFL